MATLKSGLAYKFQFSQSTTTKRAISDAYIYNNTSRKVFMKLKLTADNVAPDFSSDYVYNLKLSSSITDTNTAKTIQVYPSKYVTGNGGEYEITFEIPQEASGYYINELTSKRGSSSTYSYWAVVGNPDMRIYANTSLDNIYINPVWYNSAPTIAPISTPSGTYTTKPTFNYTVVDADGNTMTITEKIDGIVFNTRTNVTSGTTLTYTPTDLAWLRTRIKQTVNVEITADDGNGGVTTVTYPITRTTAAIDLQLKTPFETDVSARRILLQLEGNIPNDAIVSVQACNNAFDTDPTWENATNLVLSGFPYPFSNTIKTGTKWGVSFKIRIERGSSTQPIYVDGIGGAFD